MPKLSPNPNPKTATNPLGAGAKSKEIDMNEFERALEAGCNELEICGLFGITINKLNRAIKEYYAEEFKDEVGINLNFAYLMALKNAKGVAMQKISMFNDSLKPDCSPAIRIFTFKVRTGYHENEPVNQNNDPINITITQVPFKPNNEYDAAD